MEKHLPCPTHVPGKREKKREREEEKRYRATGRKRHSEGMKGRVTETQKEQGVKKNKTA